MWKKRIDVPNLLILCGEGKNTGKTTLSRFLINQYKGYYNIAAIKISPHFHNNNDENKLIWKTLDARIYQENEITDKDSSLFLQSGANPVYYIESKDNKLKECFSVLLELIGNNYIIICESASLVNYFKPGVFIFIESGNVDKVKVNKEAVRALADLIINVEKGKLESELLNISSKIKNIDKHWFIK